MNFPLYECPTIEPSNSSYGRWVIRLSEVTFRFFWKRVDAERFLRENFHEGR